MIIKNFKNQLNIEQVRSDQYNITRESRCEDGFVDDCSGDGDCCPESWIGDGYCDGTDAAWGLNFACAEYDCDGCDCVGDPGQSAECEAECGGEAVNPGGEKQLFSSNPERILS